MNAPAEPGPTPSDPADRVVIAGAGAAGTLMALHLAHAAAGRAIPLEIVLVDPAGPLDASAAFATDDDRHLLNVPAAGMSAHPDTRLDFVAWRAEHVAPTEAYDFVPRRDFARYLRARLDAAVAAAPAVHLHLVRSQAVGAGPVSAGVRVRTGDGDAIDARALVVATGLGPPGVDWAPATLRASPRFVADPWRPGALDALGPGSRAGDDVLIVGTGLTMIDIVLTTAGEGRRILAVSPSGALPHPHAPEPVTALTVDVAGWGSELDAIRAHVEDHVRAAWADTGDWRGAIDGLRPVTATLWSRLSEADRMTFLERDAGAWNRARHRSPAASIAQLDALVTSGRLEIRAGRVAAVEPVAEDRLRVRLDDGTSHTVGWVVNAAGPRVDTTAADPLVADLVARGLACPATAGMGVRTDRGRLVTADGAPRAPIWTLGALRRGELWESTAVPEIRSQAAALATELTDAG